MIQKVRAAAPEILLFLAALAVRLAAIGSRSLAYDDAFSIFLAKRSLAEIVSGTAADTMPPLYYFLLHGWMKVGDGVIWLRLMSVLVSLATMVVFYWFVQRLAGRKAALWAGLFLAISPIHLYHAQDLRMYSLLTLLVCVHWAAAYKAIQADGKVRWYWWALIWASAALAFYTHNLAGFSLIAPSVYLVVQRKWRLLARLLAAQGAALLAYLPWLLLLPGQIAKIQTAFWTPRPGALEVIQTIILFSANLPLPGIRLVLGLIASLVIFATLAWWLLRQGKKIARFSYSLALLLTAPTLLFLLSQFMRPVYVQRAFLPASLAYFLLAGVCLAESFSASTGGLPRAAAVGLLLAGLFAARLGFVTHTTFNQFPRSPFLDLVTELKTSAFEGTCILHDNKLSYFPARYYAPDLAQSFLADEPGGMNDTFAPASQQAMGIFPAEAIQMAAAGCERVAFILFDQTLIEVGGLEKYPPMRYLQEHFVPVGKASVGDLSIFTYQVRKP